MSDVYIVYPKENFDTSEKLHMLLSSQWEVWWDDNIVGDWRLAIEENLANTKCIVALISAFSRKATVTEELRIGQQHTPNIIALSLDGTAAPYPFGSVTSIDFRDWKGEADHPSFLQLQRKIGRVAAPKAKPDRLQATAAGRLPIPNVFMSVSSHETQFDPADALTVLKIHNTSSILVSAYDLVKSHDRENMIKEIKAYRENGGFVLMDSGNYEATRLNDKDWKPSHFKQVLKEALHDWAFMFDTKQGTDPQATIKQIIKAVERDSKYSIKPVLPIVHVKQNELGLAQLPEIVRGVSEQLNPPVIAIPERELGAGIAARAKTMMRIRTELSKLPYYQPIHLLGTGHPWSIAVLVAAGADTFDGLEWCRFAIDPEHGRLHHFQHFDFFKNKGERTSFLDMVDEDQAIEYAGKVAFYNLEYYAEFGRIMREMISTKDTALFATGTIRGISIQALRKLFQDVFP
ncbi:hypothetical protein HNP12_004563 [Aeromonas hydrophila]|uniref:TIR domain-containing protein n=1 Tax=Aeromonas hydrophila TaxID=644 RepID=UPI00216AA27A|nr:TIR domain-containing protein [Aeromonas hydrophila]MCS3770422.1 hypothetical protein [Aeromonas hydrophila]